MAQAGFTSVFIGIETPSESGLVECHKTQNINRNLLESVHKIQSHGIQVMAGFIIGFDSDLPGIFEDQFRFIQQSGIITAMVGILQAPYGTQLFSQLKTDHRIIDGMNGDNADGTTNIITKMDPITLAHNYKVLMRKLYAPEHFYSRIYTFLKYFNPHKSPVTLNLVEIGAFLKTIWHMGIVGSDRKEYWRLFFNMLINTPNKLPIAITLAVYGYHFRSVAELHLK